MKYMALVSAMALGSSCFGMIVGTTGAATLVSPPASLASGVFASSTQAFAINEKQGVLFNGVIDKYLPIIGLAYTASSATPVAPGPRWVNSHIIHFDNRFQPQAGPVTGTVTFDKVIIGVNFTRPRLDASDAALGNPGTIYPFGWANRGFSTVIDTFTVVNPFTIRFTLANTQEMDEIRVLTLPGPGSLAAAGAMLVLRRRRR